MTKSNRICVTPTSGQYSYGHSEFTDWPKWVYSREARQSHLQTRKGLHISYSQQLGPDSGEPTKLQGEGDGDNWWALF